MTAAAADRRRKGRILATNQSDKLANQWRKNLLNKLVVASFTSKK